MVLLSVSQRFLLFDFVRSLVATVGRSRFFAYGDRWNPSVTRGLAVA